MDKKQRFFFDATSKDNYLSILNSVDLENNLEKRERDNALKYAYHIFFRRMIEISFVKINYLKNNKFTINVNSVSDLLPNSNDQLDLLIDGITNNKDFINKNEKIILNKILIIIQILLINF